MTDEEYWRGLRRLEIRSARKRATLKRACRLDEKARLKSELNMLADNIFAHKARYFSDIQDGN